MLSYNLLCNSNVDSYFKARNKSSWEDIRLTGVVNKTAT